MRTMLENLPNEVLLVIFSNMKWFELIESFWSLNERFNSLICLKISMNKNQISVSKRDVFFNRCCSILSSRICHLSSFFACVQSIYIDGRNSNCRDILSEWIFHDKILRCLNLKKFILTECYVTKTLINNLSLLIQDQLDELILKFDTDLFRMFPYEPVSERNDSNKESKLMLMFQKFLRKLFSGQCQLTSLELDISNDISSVNIHRCFSFSSDIHANRMNNELATQCHNLRHLTIRLNYGYILDRIIQHVPALESLKVEFTETLVKEYSHVMPKRFAPTFVNWYDKIRKLKSFILQSVVVGYSQLHYLKSILNNADYVEKLRLHLEIKNWIYKDFIDGYILREYFLPDLLPNLVHWDFYIAFKCERLSSNDVQTIIDSIKTDRFFVDHHWTNVQCFYDPIMSYQHLSSTTIIQPKFHDGMINYPTIFDWNHVKYIKMDLSPSIYAFLTQFDTLFPHLTCIQFRMGRHKYISEREYSLFLRPSLDTRQCQLDNIRFRYVTRLDFGSGFYRNSAFPYECIEADKLRAEALAYLMSMPIELIYLRIEQFQWLLDLKQYASDKLRENALNTVRHLEVCLTSCHRGSNETVCMGKNLVPLISSYMPNLQTLRLWRNDDFPWTSIRPKCRDGHFSYIWSRRWVQGLQTFESIEQHVSVFKQDLMELVEQLKEFVYFDIYAKIRHEKIKPYRSMVQTYFPNCRVFINKLIFRLWF